MAIVTTLAGCNANPALNGPDGSTDLPSTLDDAIRYALSFIAQLRDGVASGGSALWMTGMIAPFATTTTPTGWLKLNGQLVSRTTYANLFAFATASGLVSDATWLSNNFGRFSSGDGSTTFRVPDMRGLYLCGLNEGSSFDPGRVFGSFQDSDNKAHAHVVNDLGHSHSGTTAGAGGHSHPVVDPGHAHTQGVQPGSGVAYAGAGGNPVPIYTNTTASVTGISLTAVADHGHAFSTNTVATGISLQSTGGVARPQNLAMPYYVKY